MSFVFRQVAGRMAFIQYPPFRIRQTDRVLQALKYNVAAFRTVAVPAERGE
ncbi:hypothetical protein [uncultured Marinobacter sp.]|uniref:hypothetical protein n=1 Tax=uncultured Marinobacter sp. TaxID=187379 RepID=UPI002617BEEF|nr:hypothetical protein [uncultured Marinobacter sp.]